MMMMTAEETNSELSAKDAHATGMAMTTEEAGATDMDEIESTIATKIDEASAKSGGVLLSATSTIAAEIAISDPDTTSTTAAKVGAEAIAAMAGTADRKTATGSLMYRGTTRTTTATIKTTKTSCFRSRTG